MDFGRIASWKLFMPIAFTNVSAARLQFWNPRKMPDARWY
jgi:hypothetical protein